MNLWRLIPRCRALEWKHRNKIVKFNLMLEQEACTGRTELLRQAREMRCGWDISEIS